MVPSTDVWVLEERMHATIRSIKVKPGCAEQVATLIESEYVPQLQQVAGFVSYTLADVGDDEVRSLGVFADQSAALRANELARDWTARSLAELVVSPLDAREGTILVDVRDGQV
jgi:quinol monooxygenase YgiN